MTVILQLMNSYFELLSPQVYDITVYSRGTVNEFRVVWVIDRRIKWEERHR